MIDELKKIDNFITSCNRRLLLEQINDEKTIYFVLINKIYTVNNRKKIMNLLSQHLIHMVGGDQIYCIVMNREKNPQGYQFVRDDEM